MAWPETVPILSARDICKGNWDGPGNTHCLSRWNELAFPDEREQSIVSRRLKAEVKRHGGTYVTDFNDDENVSKDFLARLWNRVMRKLGYRVGNPEASKR